eukprot:gene4364-3174_t
MSICGRLMDLQLVALQEKVLATPRLSPSEVEPDNLHPLY